MLFNSYTLVLLFLPITLVGYWIFGFLRNHRVAKVWLVACSLFFYGWWNPIYLGLIAASIVFNYSIGRWLTHLSDAKASNRKGVLALGVAGNLSLLGYFKYADFFVANLNDFAGASLPLPHIVLPLAISFFTFQQIAYVVDAYYGYTEEHNFFDYSLFVTFFPQLIAGPIVHHKDMLPQFGKRENYRFNAENMSVGISIFAMGLFKKVVLADGIARYATPVFDAAAAGATMSFLEAWGGALAYTFQLYFDFSGYSDMAIGLGRMFGIKLPLNFNSPYKATNITDFWRRWHMTLSQFLRDYLYIPLGGNRKGKSRRLTNLMITMLLGGLWHGAGWTFVIWGGLHGVYLVIHQAFRTTRKTLGHDDSKSRPWSRGLARTVTFFAVVIGWVLFRAVDFSSAMSLLKSMAGLNGFHLPHALQPMFAPLASTAWYESLHFTGPFMNEMFSGAGVAWVVILWIMAWTLPNTAQVFESFKPVHTYRIDSLPARWSWIQWRPVFTWSVVIFVCTLYPLMKLSEISEFLYFQF